MIQYKGGNGSSKEKAVIIVGAESELEGLDAQFECIEHKCGYFDVESQWFFNEGDRQFDCLMVIGVTGNKEQLWFDVTDYYGMDDD